MNTPYTLTPYYTEEEVRKRFIEQIRVYAKYWANQSDRTDQEKADGLAFSILNIFDGTVPGLPAMDIELAPHPSDKDFHINKGEKYFQEGMLINACQLHDLYYRSKNNG